jgi:hypothetical protein
MRQRCSAAAEIKVRSPVGRCFNASQALERRRRVHPCQRGDCTAGNEARAPVPKAPPGVGVDTAWVSHSGAAASSPTPATEFQSRAETKRHQHRPAAGRRDRQATRHTRHAYPLASKEMPQQPRPAAPLRRTANKNHHSTRQAACTQHHIRTHPHARAQVRPGTALRCSAPHTDTSPRHRPSTPATGMPTAIAQLWCSPQPTVQPPSKQAGQATRPSP